MFVALSVLGACSMVKVAYNQAPDLTYWWLDAYFDFNERQSPQLRDELAKFFAWHRSSELPKTADVLGQAAQWAASEVSADQACRIYDQARGLMDNVTQQALPALARLAVSITPDQLAHLERKYAKNVDEFRRDFILASAAARDARRLKQSTDRSEMFYGKLDEAQFTAIRQVLATSGFDAQLALKERLRRQRELLGILGDLSAARASEATSQHALRVYLQRVWESPDPAYRAYAQRMVAQACQGFAVIHASTTPAQRAHAVKVLKGYEADLRALAGNR